MLSQHRGPKKEDQLAEAIRILSNENVSDFVCETQLKVLCNMAVTPENRILERELHVIPVLSKILQQKETTQEPNVIVSLTLQTLANLALNDPKNQYEIYTATIGYLVPIVKAPKTTDILIKTLRVLVTLACHKSVSFHMIERLQLDSIILEFLTTKHKINEHEVLNQTMNWARNLLLRDQLQSYLIEGTPLIPTLISIASDPSFPETIVSNAVTLLSLVGAFRDDYRKMLIDHGALQHMAALFSSVSPQTLPHVLSTLTNISIADDVEENFLKSDCIPQLVNLLYSNNEEILEGAANVLSNLCTNNSEVRNTIDSSGGSKLSVCFLLTSHNFQVQLAGAKLVGNLSLNHEIAEKLVKFGARTMIKNIFEKFSDVPSVKSIQDSILQNMSSVPDSLDAKQTLNSNGTLEMSRRQKIAEEILSTETSYMTSLGLALRYYYVPIKMMDDKPLLSSEDLKHIFSIFDTLYKLNAEFFKEIKPLVDHWTEDTNIGDCFLQFSKKLRLYTEYINNYELAMETYVRCLKQPAFKAFCVKARDFTRGLDLPSYLIMPVQRIPRYILLLQDYKSNTEESHPDYQNLTKALETLKNIADRINEEKRNQERRMRMVQLNSTLTHSDALGKLIVPGRMLIKEGPVVFHKSVNKVSKSGYLFLFSDMLMYTKKSKEKFDMQYKIDLDDKNFEVKPIPDSEDVTNAMFIRGETVNMTISLDSAKERDQWISEIQEICSSLQSKMKRLSL